MEIKTNDVIINMTLMDMVSIVEMLIPTKMFEF